ncbi:MAG: energy transducer TonB [Enhygromyxa sp.]
MFEATLHAADPDRQRLQHLTLAAAIAIAASAAAAASVWTLERLNIDRIGGPAQKLELAHLSLLPPPKPVAPPPPPPELRESNSGAGPTSTAAAVTKPSVESLTEQAPSATSPRESKLDVGSQDRGIPDFNAGPGCPGGLCLGSEHRGETTPCLGPRCGTDDTISGSGSGSADPAPAEVEFSALRCLACGDPDRAALRKTAAATQRRNGKVVARFCVDHSGRVEARSIEISRSHGDPAVDRITTAALQRWRFSPMKVGNTPRRACSSATFNIRFD